MHAGKTALIRILPGLLFMALACTAAAQKDAAEKVQEGNVDNWIEYYKKQREPAVSPPGGAAGEKRDERKERREKGGSSDYSEANKPEE